MNNVEKTLILSALDNGLDAAVVDIKAAIEILKKEEATDGLNAKIAGGIRVNVKLNDKGQISYISNYAANATVVMDE